MPGGRHRHSRTLALLVVFSTARMWLPLRLLNGLLPGSFVDLQSLRFQFVFRDV